MNHLGVSCGGWCVVLAVALVLLVVQDIEAAKYDWESNECNEVKDIVVDGVADSDYERSSRRGALRSSDRFASVITCAHNRYRNGAGLKRVTWHNDLYKLAKNHNEQMLEDCELFRDTEQMQIGPWGGNGGQSSNMFLHATETFHEEDASIGARAVDQWFSQVNQYQYGGESAAYDHCELRNMDQIPETNLGGASITAFTQMMWPRTAKLGCEQGACKNTKIINGTPHSVRLVTCYYGPSGNIHGFRAFKKSEFDKLNEWMVNNNNTQYGEVPTC